MQVLVASSFFRVKAVRPMLARYLLIASAQARRTSAIAEPPGSGVIFGALAPPLLVVGEPPKLLTRLVMKLISGLAVVFGAGADAGAGNGAGSGAGNGSAADLAGAAVAPTDSPRVWGPLPLGRVW